MLIRRPPDITPSEITPESIYLSRRQFMDKGAKWAAAAGIAAAGGAVSANVLKSADGPGYASPPWLDSKIMGSRPAAASADKVTPYEYVTSYNNFYEFGTDKGDPAANAGQLSVDPWSVQVSGECGKPGSYTLEDILRPHDLEERIYRLRCVEAWSMVVPWLGFPLADLLRRFEPTGDARFVRFKTLVRPQEMPGQRSVFSSIDWPYVEGLRMDEAMHPLTLVAVGLYGQVMPKQNGAPLRLVVPWKYGFKSIKSIVSIEFSERRPRTTWEMANSREYGFYSNVNPEVDHPRWSQKTERRLPSTLFSPNRIKTLKFNGYEEQVAELYAGMNLRKDF